MINPILQQLRELIHAQPFQPFTIVLVNGTTYHVPHEDFLVITKSGLVIFDDGQDLMKNINSNLVLEIHQKAAA